VRALQLADLRLEIDVHGHRYALLPTGPAKRRLRLAAGVARYS
jgi:hypothetical protein